MTLAKVFTTRDGFTMSPTDVVVLALKAGVSYTSLDEIIIAMIDPEVFGEIGSEGYSIIAEKLD